MEAETQNVTTKERAEFTVTYTVDSFANGIAFGQHRMPVDADPRDFYALQLTDENPIAPLRSRYALNKGNPLAELEANLIRLSKQGVLRSSIIYFGTATDPFFPFEGKFDASMKFLQMFEKYTPGHLVVQTRSPLAVIAMPVFKKLGKNCSVTIGVETHREDAVERYTPGLPRVSERLKTATALRRFGIEVTLQVGPVLPYGDWRSDAEEFAKVLSQNGDLIYVRPFTNGSEKDEKLVKNSAIARRIAEDRKFHYLRHDAANPLITALEKICPDKLRIPRRAQLESKQVNMFAA